MTTTHVIWLKAGSFNVSGRVYTAAAANTSADLPQFDVPVLQGQGALIIVAPSGPTSARPAVGNVDVSGQAGRYANIVGDEFYDTSLSQLLKCDAAGNWHRCDTGAIV